MTNANDQKLAEEWLDRLAAADFSLVDPEFLDRLARAGEQSRQDAALAAKAAGFETHWDWLVVLSKRISMMDGEPAENPFQRFFCLRFSLDASGPPRQWAEGLSATSLPLLAQALLRHLQTGEAPGNLAPSALGLLSSVMGPSDPLPVGSLEAVQLQGIAAAFRRQLNQRRNEISPLAMIQGLLGLLLLESLGQGRLSALEMMLKRFKPIASHPLIYKEIGRVLYFSGAYENFALLQWLKFLAPGRMANTHIGQLPALLFLASEAPPEWPQKLFFEWVSPNIHLALSKGNFSTANFFLMFAGPSYLSPYSEEQNKKISGDYLPAIEKSAAQFKDAIGSLPIGALPGADLDEEGPLSIAIVTMMPIDWGTPIRLALLLINAITQYYPGRLRFFLYGPLGMKDDSVIDNFQKQGVAVRWMDDRQCPKLQGVDSVISKFVYLRNELAKEKIGVVVYFRGSDLYEAIFSQLRLSPVQIFWSMGFDWPPYRNMDGFISTIPKRHMAEEVNGRLWNWHRLLYHALPEPLEAEVKRLQATFVKGRFVFGVLCQSFKLDSEPFIAVLAEVLKRTPGSIFVWTGNYKPYNVIKMMTRHGVRDRCHFIGWAPPMNGHQIIDVFLDTFPVGNGASAVEAMFFSKPVVSLAGDFINLPTYFFEPARKGWFGEEDKKKFSEITKDGGYLLCATADDYVLQCVRLATDQKYYEKACQTAYALATGFAFNGQAAAASFVAAIKDIVLRARAQKGGKKRPNGA